jgi:Tol biopolymer transport system component
MRAFLPHRTASALFSALVLAGVCLGQTTECVSVDSSGIQGNGPSGVASISADGRYVAFSSYADDLVIGDFNGRSDGFIHDRKTGVTERVSVSSSGVEGNHSSSGGSISANGQYVAFLSSADNLVAGDINGVADIFVHDRHTGVTERVSVNSAGRQGNDRSGRAFISADGRYVAFDSKAGNLASGDTNRENDVFVHDRQTGVTERVSVSSSGGQGNDFSECTSISADGRYVAFGSDAKNLVSGDTNKYMDSFIHDRQTGMTVRVSVDPSGVEGNGLSGGGSLSADGRFVAFSSSANNLVLGDSNRDSDVFVHDRQTGLTERVSLDSLGAEANDGSFWDSISADGRYVAFMSYASNLVPGDTNRSDLFVHDRETGITERVSVNSLGTEGNNDSVATAISADGRYVGFNSEADNLVHRDINSRIDVFIHDRWSGKGQNSIYLSGPATAPVGAPIDFNWQATRGSSHYWLLYSQNMNGARKDGHKFDIGYPASILARGVNSTNGLGSHTTLPVPPRAAGYTIYFEVAARDENGVAYDSNVVGVTFQ